MKPWRDLIEPDQIDIVAPDGTIRCNVPGYYDGKQFIIDDANADIQTGDEIRRLLENGKEEAFNVIDPVFFKDKAGRMFGSHYQVKVSRKGAFSPHTGGNYSINLQGSNARVNINSTDNSINVAIDRSTLSDLRNAITSGVADQVDRAKLLSAVDDLEQSTNQKNFAAAYQALIGSAANHMTILTPFLPALAQMLSQLPA